MTRPSLTAVRARIFAVLCEGRGADSALGALALARSITAARYRASVRFQGNEGAAALRDPSYKPADFDRAVSLEWDSTSDDADAGQDRAAESIRVLRARLVVGYVQGAGMTRYARVVSPETQADAVARAPERALEDAEEMRLALGCSDLVSGDGLSPSIIGGLAREGESIVTTLGDARLLCTTRYRMRLRFT